MAQSGPPPLRIRIERSTARVTYTCTTVLGGFLGIPFVLVESGDFDLDYTRSPDPEKPALVCSGLLYTTGIAADADPGEDLLALFFYRLSQYAELAAPRLDAHGRYVNHVPGLALHGALKQLGDFLRGHFSWIRLREPQFSWELTIDVDQPWKYLHKPWPVRWGGLVRDAVRGRWGEAKVRLGTLMNQRDPFDALPEIERLCPPETTTVFFLSDGRHPLDSRFSLRQCAYQAYVKAFLNRGFRIGIHPSYLSSEQPDLIGSEKALLENAAGEISCSRQHYLRYRLPSTFAALTEAGICEDYTLCPHEGLGARTGIALPYMWYNLAAETVTSLRLVPAVVMDRTLQQYMGLTPAAAIGKTREVIDSLRRSGGHFVLILHNETFSEAGEWKGWRRWISETVAYLKSDGSNPETSR